MIDLHCHILPGVDDGSQNEQDALDLARAAYASGIKYILCTPHHHNGRFLNPKADIIRRVSALQALLDREKIPLKVFEGQEVRIFEELPSAIARDEILFCDLSKKYLLIEFPTTDVPNYTSQLFTQLLARKHTPVIVHPERNRVFGQDPNKLVDFLEMGCLAQLTAPSYVGVFGKTIQKTARLMVAHEMVQLVASDAHHIQKRGFHLKEAYAAIARDFGEERTAYYEDNAKRVLNGDALPLSSYTRVKKTIFGNFK